jgi:hypothetical protein
VCDGGLCRKGCDVCGPGRFCAGGGRCERQPCAVLEDCPEGIPCDGSVCLAACLYDRECKSAEICQDGACVVDPGTCTRASDCPEGTLCDAGTCRLSECQLGCGQGELCVLGRCVRHECDADADCRAGLVCANRVCAVP